MIKVLIVEDSKTISHLLKNILEKDKDIKVIGVVENGIDALDFLKNEKPDIITMDIIMPKMDGFETTKRIMSSNPIPIIVFSSAISKEDTFLSFKILELGALTIIEKPLHINEQNYNKIANNLINQIKTYATVKVVTRKYKSNNNNKNEKVCCKNTENEEKFENNNKINLSQLNTNKFKIVAIGASTGGPPVLEKIIKEIKEPFPVPILIVQHISQGFTESMVQWLIETTGKNIKIGKNNEKPTSNTIYFAPVGFNIGINKKGLLDITKPLKKQPHTPSVSHLFQSTFEFYKNKTIGIILTGMGRDGSDEIKLIKDSGGLTIAQNCESSVVFGMNKIAIENNGINYVLSPEGIIFLLNKIVINGGFYE